MNMKTLIIGAGAMLIALIFSILNKGTDMELVTLYFIILTWLELKDRPKE